MATIPLGNFGNQTAGQTPGVSVSPEAFGAGTANALTQIGGQVGAMANRNEAIKRQEEEKKQQEQIRLAGAKASNATLQYEQDVYSVTEGLQRDINAGKIDYTKAQEEYQARVSKIAPADIPNLDPVGNEIYTKGLDRAKGKYSRVVDGLVEVKRKDDAKAQFGTALESLDNLSGIPGANPDELKQKAMLFGENAKAAGLDAAMVDKSVSALGEGAWLNHARNRFIQSQSSVTQLKALEHDLTKGLYADKFDAGQRTALISTITNRRDQLIEKAQRDSDRREAKAQNALNGLLQLQSTGYNVSPEAMASTADAVKGTSLEGQFHAVVQQGQQIEQVLRLPPVEQIAFLNKKQSEIQQKGISSPADVANFNRLQGAVKHNIEMMQTDPMAFDSNRTGNNHPPLDMSNFGSQQNAANISDRVNTLYAMRKQYGPSIAIKPLTEQEAQMIGTTMRTLSPQQQAAMLGTLKKQITDPEAYKGAIQQMFKDDNLMVAAGMFAVRDIRTNGGKGKSIADLVLSGRMFLQDKSVIVPKDKAGNGEALLPAFNKYVSTAIPIGSPAREASYQTAKAIYVALSKDEGEMDGTFNQDRMQRAVDLAVGGIVQYSDKPTLKPHGMSTDAFEGRIKFQVRAAATSAGLPTKAYDYLPVDYAGGGKYYVKNGLEYVKDKSGRPLLIDPQMPIPVEPIPKAENMQVLGGLVGSLKNE
jgi:hypothetical protein